MPDKIFYTCESTRYKDETSVSRKAKGIDSNVDIKNDARSKKHLRPPPQREEKPIIGFKWGVINGKKQQQTEFKKVQAKMSKKDFFFKNNWKTETERSAIPFSEGHHRENVWVLRSNCS